MKTRLLYVELKSGHADDGPAWISVARLSKSESTIYSNGKAFRSLKGSGIGANYFDILTGEEYWISGVKKNNEDRHWAGGGQIHIDRGAMPTYLAETEASAVPSNLILCDLAPSEQLPEHADAEHRAIASRDSSFSASIPHGRGGSIKRKG